MNRERAWVHDVEGAEIIIRVRVCVLSPLLLHMQALRVSVAHGGCVGMNRERDWVRDIEGAEIVIHVRVCVLSLLLLLHV
jgi:hypothetical protein